MYNRNNRINAQLLDIPLVQRLNLQLMEMVSFNKFDGTQVVKDLLDYKDIWESCVMDRESTFDNISLIKLRDMGREMVERIGYPIWNVDTLFILVNTKDASENIERMVTIAKEWNADEIDYLPKENAQKLLGGGLEDPKVLRVFWD